MIGRLSDTSARDREIRQHEVAFRMTNRQHGAPGRADDPFGHASHQQVRDRAPAVRADDDQIDVRFGGVVDDGGCRGARRDRRPILSAAASSRRQ